MSDKLKELGFTEKRLQEAASSKDLVPARVIARDKNLYRVAVAGCDLPAEVGGRFNPL